MRIHDEGFDGHGFAPGSTDNKRSPSKRRGQWLPGTQARITVGAISRLYPQHGHQTPGRVSAAPYGKSSSISTCSCLATGLPMGTRRRLPDMPRWLIRPANPDIHGAKKNRYLARRESGLKVWVSIWIASPRDRASARTTVAHNQTSGDLAAPYAEADCRGAGVSNFWQFGHLAALW